MTPRGPLKIVAGVERDFRHSTVHGFSAIRGMESIMFSVPALTQNRIRLAYAVAVAADAVQLLLGPAGWIIADEVIDMIAMALIAGAIGFHPLLLPTFILEFVPVVDLLPTWTGCVAWVVSLRKREQSGRPPPRGPVIDV